MVKAKLKTSESGQLEPTYFKCLLLVGLLMAHNHPRGARDLADTGQSPRDVRPLAQGLPLKLAESGSVSSQVLPQENW